MPSPTQRSLEYCRKHGWDAGVVERHNTYSGKKHDLFGFADLLVMDGGALAVQATSGSNVAARVKKIKAEPRAARWAREVGRIEVWGWRKVAAYRKDGTRAKRDRWELRRVPVTFTERGAK